LGQRRRRDAVTARLVRLDRAGLLPAVDQAEMAEGSGAAVPGDDADLARVSGRALGHRRPDRVGDRRRYLLVLELAGGPSAARARRTQHRGAGHVVMDPPSYLLDRTFLVALADVDDPNHDEAKESYRRLIDDF